MGRCTLATDLLPIRHVSFLLCPVDRSDTATKKDTNYHDAAHFCIGMRAGAMPFRRLKHVQFSLVDRNAHRRGQDWTTASRRAG